MNAQVGDYVPGTTTLIPVISRPNRSESIAQLVAALSKAQGQIEGAKKDSDNPYFKSKYADLAAVWEACRKPLSQNELAIIQTVDDTFEDGRICIETMLAHSSGEWISHRIRLKPVKDDAQAIGSTITYGRRYGLQSIVGIAAEDDDGNAASGKNASGAEPRQQPTNNKSKQSTTVGAPAQHANTASKGDVTYINEQQRKRFYGLCGERKWSNDDAKTMLMDFGVFTSTKIPAADYERICKIIETHDYASYLDSKSNPAPKAS